MTARIITNEGVREVSPSVGASPDGDRATRPADQAASRLGDTASVPSARRCPKHEPKPHGDTLQRMRGDVICERCGREGMYSRGNRKWGRPPRVIWFRGGQ